MVGTSGLACALPRGLADSRSVPLQKHKVVKWLLVLIVVTSCAAGGVSDRRITGRTAEDVGTPTLHTPEQLVVAPTAAWSFYEDTLRLFPPNVSPPHMDWVQGPRLDCADETGFTTGERDKDDNTLICFGGDYTPGSYTARVSVVPSRSLSHDGVLTHELCHALAHFAHYYADGSPSDGDPNHIGPCFVPGGYVEQANAALAQLSY